MKYILLLIIGFSVSLLVSAQIDNPLNQDQDTISKFRIFDKLYLQLEGGSQVLFSQDAGILENKDRLTPHVALSLGTWLSPVFGAEIKAQGATLNGFTSLSSLPILDNDPVRDYVTIRPDGSYRHYIRNVNVSMNLFVSTANLLAGKEKQHWFDILPSAGVGLMHVFDYKGIPAKNTMSYNFGLSATCRISSRLKFVLNGNGIMLPNEFESRDAGDNTYDWIASVDAGLIWYLGRGQ